MRWVSLEAARASAAESLKRFPLSLISAWTAAIVADWLTIVETRNAHPVSMPLLFAATLGIPMFFAIALLCERVAARSPSPSRGPQAVMNLAGLLVLVLMVVLWPRWSEPIQVRRYVQLSLLMHALVAFLPYVGVREPNGFWQYNRTLLMRLIVASIFSSVLYSGLEGALFALKPLFGITISPKAHLVLSSSIYFIFHPWFFLAGIPRDLSSLDRRTDYPGVIRIFAQFILVPLVAVYQALLTAYLFKVVFTGQWPQGLIGWLVSTEAIFGVLAILLIHPVRDLPENRWVRTFARAFYLALIPSIVMLAMAISKRVGQYGVTEDRYFLMVLTGWLALISVYFIARRDGDIRVIPITLAALAILTFAGPWGAYTVSRASQSARLRRVLEANGLLVHGTIRPATHDVPRKTERDLSSILDYLIQIHGTEAVEQIMGDVAVGADSAGPGPDSHITWTYTRNKHAFVDSQRILERIGVRYLAPWEGARSFNYYAAYDPIKRADRVTGFDYHVRLNGVPPITIKADSMVCVFSLDPKTRRLVLTAGRDSLAFFALDPVLTNVVHGAVMADTSGHGMRIEALPGGIPARLTVDQLSGTDDRELEVSGIGADLYFTLRRP
jgi:hypothetical protein